jgi:hypothetical protein
VVREAESLRAEPINPAILARLMRRMYNQTWNARWRTLSALTSRSLIIHDEEARILDEALE